MNRIVSTALMVLLAVLSNPIVPVGPATGGIAWAQMDTEMETQLGKIKKMVTEIEMKMKAKGMAMDAMGKEKTMKMLMDIAKMLQEVERQSP